MSQLFGKERGQTGEKYEYESYYNGRSGKDEELAHLAS